MQILGDGFQIRGQFIKKNPMIIASFAV